MGVTTCTKLVSSMHVYVRIYVHLFTTQLWDASTGMELADFRGHSDMVTCCALSDSGRFVVSSSEDCTVRVSTHLYTFTVDT